MPSTAASSPAPTVPEYTTSSATFAPWLIPLTTRSASAASPPSSPARTQSVGVPSHSYTGFRPPSSRRTPTGRSNVHLRANPLRSPSGATVTTDVHTGARAARIARMPADRTPSSLVSRTRTLSPSGEKYWSGGDGPPGPDKRWRSFAAGNPAVYG